MLHFRSQCFFYLLVLQVCSFVFVCLLLLLCCSIALELSFQNFLFSHFSCTAPHSVAPCVTLLALCLWCYSSCVLFLMRCCSFHIVILHMLSFFLCCCSLCVVPFAMPFLLHYCCSWYSFRAAAYALFFLHNFFHIVPPMSFFSCCSSYVVFLTSFLWHCSSYIAPPKLQFTCYFSHVVIIALLFAHYSLRVAPFELQLQLFFSPCTTSLVAIPFTLPFSGTYQLQTYCSSRVVVVTLFVLPLYFDWLLWYFPLPLPCGSRRLDLRHKLEHQR